MNVHLSPFIIPRGSGLIAAYGALSEIERIHGKEGEAIATQINAELPTLVCGDFNSRSNLSFPRLLGKLGFIDSFAAVNKNPDSFPTWHWPIGRTRIQFRIEYVFHSSHFETKKSRIISTKGSDHELILSELGIRRPF